MTADRCRRRRRRRRATTAASARTVVLTIGHPDVPVAIDVNAVREVQDPGAERFHQVAVRVELQDRRQARTGARVLLATLRDPDAHAVAIDLDRARGAPDATLGQFRPTRDRLVGVREVVRAAACPASTARAAPDATSVARETAITKGRRWAIAVLSLNCWSTNQRPKLLPERHPRMCRRSHGRDWTAKPSGGLSIRTFFRPSSSPGSSFAPPG